MKRGHVNLLTAGGDPAAPGRPIRVTTPASTGSFNHPIRHDRSRELGAFANPQGRACRKNSAIGYTGLRSCRLATGTHLSPRYRNLTAVRARAGRPRKSRGGLNASGAKACMGYAREHATFECWSPRGSGLCAVARGMARRAAR
jgi:hypothetical protein